MRGSAVDLTILTHGKRKTPEYGSWMGMRSRCRNPNSAGDYPGSPAAAESRSALSGIDFAAFLRVSWVPRRSLGHSLGPD